MKAPVLRFLTSFALICAASTIALGVSSCSLLSNQAAATHLVPRLPESLRAWNADIIWETSGTCVQVGSYEPDSKIEIKKELHPDGDWVSAKPVFSAYSPWGSAPEPLLPTWGWITGASVGGDTSAGLVAKLLEICHDQNLPITGLNTIRLLSQVQYLDLDTQNVDRVRLLEGILHRNLTIYDIISRAQVSCAVSLPHGDWVDARGETVHNNSTGGPASVFLNLPLGVSDLFRRDGSAYLRLQVSEGGDGNPVALGVLHQLPQ